MMQYEKEAESKVESELVKKCKLLGFKTYKITQQTHAPDRLIITPNKGLFFIECKATGKKPSTGQYREHRNIRKLNTSVYILDHTKDIDAILGNYI